MFKAVWLAWSSQAHTIHFWAISTVMVPESP